MTRTLLRRSAALLAAVLLFTLFPQTQAADGTAKTVSYAQKTVGTLDILDRSWLVLGLARGGYLGKSDARAFYDGVAKISRETSGILNARMNTVTSRTVIALTAAGYNAADVAGYDLTLPLADFDLTKRQGIGGSIWALLALDCGGYAIAALADKSRQATRERYVNEILAREITGGGFALTGNIPDPDVTAMALMALSKYRARTDVNAAVKRGVSVLVKKRKASGGYASYGTENAESCAQVMAVYCELGMLREAETLENALLSYQLSDGSFSHIKNGATDLKATEQALYALVSLGRLRTGQSSLLRMDTAFNDLDGHPYRVEINALCEKGILSGMGDGTFAPDKTLTRAQFAAIACRAAGVKPSGTPGFADVSPDAWYAGYVAAASNAGFILGRGAGIFDPEGKITDAEADVLLDRVAKYLGLTGSGAVWKPSQTYITRGQTAHQLYELLKRGKLL